MRTPAAKPRSTAAKEFQLRTPDDAVELLTVVIGGFVAGRNDLAFLRTVTDATRVWFDCWQACGRGRGRGRGANSPRGER